MGEVRIIVTHTMAGNYNNLQGQAVGCGQPSGATSRDEVIRCPQAQITKSFKT